MKTVVIAIFAIFASQASAYAWSAPENWTEVETPAVITGPRKAPIAKAALVKSLAEVKCVEGRFILKFKMPNPAYPRMGHPALAGDYLDGKEVTIEKAGAIFFLESVEGKPVFFVKMVGKSSICLVCEWEGYESNPGLVQIDRGEFFLGVFDIKLEEKETNQAPVPTATSVTPAADAPVAPAAAAARP